MSTGLTSRHIRSQATASLQRAISDLVTRTAAEIGETYLETLVRELPDVLHCRGAFLLERRSRTSDLLRPVSVCLDGRPLQLDDLPLHMSVAEHARPGGAAVFLSHAPATFPDDALLATLEAESVIVVPVLAMDGAPNGFLGISNSSPFEDSLGAEAILLLISPRVGAEIERLQAAAKLQEQAQLTRDFMERADDVIMRTLPGESPVIEYVNPAFERLTGYSRDDFYADPQLLLRIAHPDDRPHFAKMFLEGDVSQPRIWRWIRRDGSILWTEGRRAVIYDRDGAPVAIESVGRDITDQRLAEERAATAQEMQRLILAAIPDTVIGVSRAGAITSIRNGETTPSPFIAPAVNGAALTQVLPPAVAPGFMRLLGVSLVSGQIESCEYEMAGDEADCVFEARIAPLDSEQAVIFFRNITGDVFLHRTAERERSKEEIEGKAERRILRANPYNLTFREFTVLELVARGLKDKQIALELSISLNTVGKHVSSILGKMGVASRTEASVRAVQEHLLD